MKARVKNEQEPRCVLLWRVSPGSTAYGAVEHAARLYRLRVRAMDERDLKTTVEELCRGRRSEGGEAAPSPTEMPAMIVSGLRHDDGDLNAFVDEVRRGGAQFALRAMVTPTSRSWTLGALLEELCREHEAVGGGQ